MVLITSGWDTDVPLWGRAGTSNDCPLSRRRTGLTARSAREPYQAGESGRALAIVDHSPPRPGTVRQAWCREGLRR